KYRRVRNEKYYPVARNSPLRFGANALGQQADMWLAIARPNFAKRNFAYPRNVSRNSARRLKNI
ncbi:MAG: hypothetical protein DRI61_16030, partial [Chloroflexi bacterium]